MTRTSLLALTCLAASALIAPQALASDAVVLRETLLVDGAHITLGDLFTVDGEAADIVVARAPEPGGRTSQTRLTRGSPSACHLLQLTVPMATARTMIPIPPSH